MFLLSFFRRPRWRGVWLGLGCSLAVWLLCRTAITRGLEDWMLDGMFFSRGERSTNARVVIIGLDEDSLDSLGKPLPFLSPELSRVVSHVHRQGAAAIGLDVMIPESMANIEELNDLNRPNNAWQLGRTLLPFDNVVLCQQRRGRGWLRPLRQWRLRRQGAEPEERDLFFIDLSEDGDQLVRRQRLLDEDEDGLVPHFALALFARARGETVRWDDSRSELFVGEEQVPLEPGLKLFVNFAGPPGRFPVLPFREVLRAAQENRAIPELDGAIVILGATARSLQDYHATPYANQYARGLPSQTPGLMSGPELHAHILATLEDRAYISTPWGLRSLIWLPVFGAGLGYLFARMSLEAGLLLAVFHHFAWKAAALAAFSWHNWHIEVVAMLLLGVLVYAATFALRWRKLRRTFGVVKSEAVALALEADPRKLRLGGEECDVTVLFADIRNFTDFSEKHTATEVVALLNAYFKAVVPIIEAEGGTILTYMGDGVMVFFNAPASLPGHPLRAARAAVRMVRRVHEQRELWAKLDRAGVWNEKGGMRIGVGIHSGKAVVGSVGSPERLDYTVIGDTVNAAARIETENKALRTEVLLSAETCAMLPPEELAGLGYAAEPHEVNVKGLKRPLILHALVVP